MPKLPIEGDSLAAELRTWREKDAKHDEWLRIIYKAHLDRMLSDNERIWRTGAIFIPLSLSGFAAFASLNPPTPTKTAVLGLASSALMLFWIFVAENHRSFQQNHLGWLVAISRAIDLPEKEGNKSASDILGRLVTFKGAIQKTRWALLLFVLILWSALFVQTLAVRVR